MRVLVTFLLAFLILGFTKNKTTNDFEEIKKIKISKLDFFTCDNFGNIYTANSIGDIVKYDKDGNKTSTVNYKSLGKVQSIDASNPFEIVVFYKEQNKAIFLDNELSLLGEMDFEKKDYYMLSAVSRSYDSKVWMFDLSDLKLKKLKKDLSLELSSGNVREFSKERSFAPIYIGDMNQHVYLFDTAAGLFQFDNFGNYIRKIVLPDAEQFFVMLGKMYFLKNNQIYILDEEMLTEKNIKISGSPEKINSFSIAPNRVVLQNEDELILYKIKKNN